MRPLVSFAVVLTFVLFAPASGVGQDYKVLYNFCSASNCTDGAGPQASLIRDAAGNFYGTTNGGGANQLGTIFKLDSTGHYTVLYSFCSALYCTDGFGPLAGLIMDTTGNLYGTTYYGGANSQGGTVFKLDSAGHYTVLYSFCSASNCRDGGYPYAGLILDAAGNLYGTTSGGGANGNGTVFKLDSAGHYTVLYNFCSASNCTDGANPLASLILDAAGNLYGTTDYGGANDIGAVFKLDSAGHYTVLYAFCSASNCTDGSNPYAGLILDTTGNLYGTTVSGGANNDGTVFKLDRAGHYTVLYSFCSASNCTDGVNALAGVILDAAGNLYGTTDYGGANQSGTVFKLDSAGHYIVFYNFCSASNCTDGRSPFAGLIQDAAGNVYGTTVAGGANGQGTVFSLTTSGTPDAVTPTFDPPAGTYPAPPTVTISDGTPGATIYYTLDGTTPTTGSTKYTAPIPIVCAPPSCTATIAAIAVANGYANSAVATVTYTVQFPVAPPILSPGAGTYTTPQSVSITDSTPGAAIYYTTDGTTPTTSSTPYTGPITVSSTQSIEAIAVASGYANSAVTSATYTISSASGFEFVPVNPCRVADTRLPDGSFGGPEMSGGQSRTFNIPQSACNIPSTAAAYSLNVTVVPDAGLNYLTIWPTGEIQPKVSTLNSDGRIKANAAIVPAGTNGEVNVYVTDPTQVVLDIDGYFAPTGTASSLAFYTLPPCRIADTRYPVGPLGGPYIAGGDSRAFPILSSDCNIPSTAMAYSLNVTAVPHNTLDYLTIWPTGEAQPYVSTLNSLTGTVVANAALVGAGTGGDASVFVFDDADVILDIDGYFAPAGMGGLLFYGSTPCRAIDTRVSGLSGNTVVVDLTSCALSTAQAYVLNLTLEPTGSVELLHLVAGQRARNPLCRR